MNTAECLERFRGKTAPHFAARAAEAQLRADAWQGARAASGAAAGLVLHSTSHTGGVQTPPLTVEGAKAWDSNTIEIDREAVRVSRLRKGAGMAAKWINLHSTKRENKVMVTLTYRGTNRDWKPHHISKYITTVRNWYARTTGGEKLRYVWVAELQQRGVIHYHAVFWLRKGVTMPKADKRGWWPHGMSNTIKAHHPVGYLMKYLSKTTQKTIGGYPHGARIYGVGGLDKAGRDCKRWVLWPSYVRQNAAAGDPFKPTPGGGYTHSSTGEFLASEWAPTGGGHSRFVRIRTTPRTMPDAGGPFSWIQ
ncbi:hypothetical protein PSQ39_21630 [Curvibacter sp. HBC28]|uniref:Replication-associated protein ORF2/G2P domain-containing protein n=1 Tax=Curvibacter microcysteis TaxID=3026419 RepID=A0ABT5MKX5_9BURK|nr:hypothetical protein [Curvibacter sp. HBC28]MDD0817250.1 hypothetical protein [Curvibacter sp. HBC28]